MSTVTVNREVLQWALKRSNLSVEETKIKFPKIELWLKEEDKPTLRQLESFAKTTRTPFGFLLLEKPPEEKTSIPYYRTLGDNELENPSPELLDTIRSMERRQSWAREYLLEEKQEPLHFVNSIDVSENPVNIANQMKDILGLGPGWASNYRTWTDALRAFRLSMEECGILVVANGIVENNTYRKLEPKEFRGFVLVDEYAPLIFINNSDGKAAQMFTMAHELAHIFLGKSAAFDLREMQPADDPIEKACDRAAAEFLIPGKEILSIWPSINNKNEPFQIMAKHFKVSVLVAARRALDLGLISKDEFIVFYNDYRQDERRTKANQKDGGDFYSNQNLRVGRRFASIVINAVREGRILYSEAYQLTGLHGKTFHQYAESIGVGGV